MALRDAQGQTGDHGTELELSPDCAAWVDLGQIRADLRFRPRPRAALSPLADRLDYAFLNLFLLALFCAAAGVVALENHATDTDLRADDVFANRPNLVKMVIRPPEKQPDRLLEKLKALDVSNTPAASAARASKPEGPAGKQTTSVSSAATARSTLNNPTMESCIAARVKSWEFPRPPGGGVGVVTYPFVFKQSGE